MKDLIDGKHRHVLKLRACIRGKLQLAILLLVETPGRNEMDTVFLHEALLRLAVQLRLV